MMLCAGAMVALIRAGKRARELARQTGTKIVVIRDGQLVREAPQMENDETEEDRK